MMTRYTFLNRRMGGAAIETIQELILGGYVREAVWRAEAAAIDSFALAGEHIDLFPRSALEASPFLLQVYGEKRWLEGKLQSAAEALQSAVKGYMKMSLSGRFLSAFAVLAVVRTQLGHWQEAETMLAFLEDEWDEKALPVTDGRIPLALAAAARVRKAPEPEARRYASAASLFHDTGLRSLALYTLAEAALRPRLLQTYPESKEALQLHAGRAGVAVELIEQLMEGRVEAPYLQELSSRHQSLLLLRELPGAAATVASEDLEVQYLQVWKRHKLLTDRGEETTALTSRLRLLKEALPYKDLDPLDEPPQAAPAPIPPQPEGWSIRCFGGFACMNRGVEITRIHWKRKKAFELLAYLLLQPGYSAVREIVADALFPDTEPARAANQLHVAAHRLRQVLLDTFQAERGLYMNDGSIYLDSQLIEQVDAETYQVQIRVAKQLWSTDQDLAEELLKEACQLYGPLLPELPYSDWLERTRAHLQELQCHALRKLAYAAEEAGNRESVEYYLNEWLTLEPTQEEAYRQLLQLLLRQGRRSEAEACYRKLEAILYDELGVCPSEETKLLLMQEPTKRRKEARHG